MVDTLAYTALVISLLSVSMKKMLSFRIIHLISSSLYLSYGLFIEAYPIALGGALFILIHFYHIMILLKQKNKEDNGKS